MQGNDESGSASPLSAKKTSRESPFIHRWEWRIKNKIHPPTVLHKNWANTYCWLGVCQITIWLEVTLYPLCSALWRHSSTPAPATDRLKASAVLRWTVSEQHKMNLVFYYKSLQFFYCEYWLLKPDYLLSTEIDEDRLPNQLYKVIKSMFILVHFIETRLQK